MSRDAYPEPGALVDRNTGIVLQEFYNGNSSTIHKAFKDGRLVATAKDRTSLVRKLAKIYKGRD